MNDIAEEWKPVVGYEGVYEVSNKGRVKRIMQCRGCRAGHILSHAKLPNGYRVVSLSKDNVAIQEYLHRVVAAAFIGQASHGMEVNHKDFDKDHNAVGNLEYGTRLENQRHCVTHQMHAFGEGCGQAKLTDDKVRAIRRMRRGLTQQEIADRYCVSRSAIGKILSGKNWRHVPSEDVSIGEAMRCSP